MTKQRLIITVSAAAAGLGAFLLSHFGSHETLRAAGAVGLGTFIGLYVVANVFAGVVQGMREANGKGPPPPAPKG